MSNFMNVRIKITCVIVLLLSVTSCNNKKQNNPDDNTIQPESWTQLLDKDLSKWEMYLSYEMKDGYNGNIPRKANGDTIAPIGYNNNYKNVFTIIEEEGSPVLKITGEVYGCVFTKASYKNYHLRLKMKWGNKKWEPRLNEALDSGLLYHSQGECGVDYWRSWMLSHEFQMIEGGCGDYWCIGPTRIDVRATKDSANLIFDPSGEILEMGAGTPNGHYCAVEKPSEKPSGEWNEVELICYGDKSLHIMNGTVVMALSGLSYMDGEVRKPLTEGKLQLQSEAAEVFYKDIEIKDISQLPSEYKKYFD